MNRVQSDSYWYDAGYKTAKTETVNQMLEILDQYYLWHANDDGSYTTVGEEIRQAVLALKDSK